MDTGAGEQCEYHGSGLATGPRPPNFDARLKTRVLSLAQKAMSKGALGHQRNER